MMRLVRTRVVPFAMSAGLAISIAAAGCSKKDEPVNPQPNMPSDEIASVEPLAQATNFLAPFDGAPNPNGDTVAFTAMTEEGAAVFRLPVAGGAPTKLVSGEPLIAPFGLVWSTDGTRLYIADTSSDDDPQKEAGRIFGMSAEGGTLDSLSGAEGLSPRSLEINNENGIDVLYFTAHLVREDVAAVFKMNADGSNRTEILKGAPLVEPSGITIDKNGTLYVTDAAGEEGATLYKIENGVATVVASGMRFGHPAGVALLPSETAVLISGLDTLTGKSTVYKVDLATGTVSASDAGIQGTADAAGIRKAKNAAVWAWANAAGETKGETITPGGTVYVLKGK